MTKKLLCETPGDDEDNLSDCPRSQARSIGPQTSNVDRLGPQLRRLPVRVIAFMVLASIVASPFGDSFAPSGIALGQSADFELAPINYLDAPVSDPVAKLSEQLEAGEAKLKWDRERGYLPAVLEALDVPVSSQTLVFSKTSLQLHRISPRQPRAVYFNDDVYVGWCQNGDVVELASTDPQQGAIFYTIAQKQSDQTKIVRDRGQCMTCHASSRTQGVPGYLVRSVFSDASGYPKFGSGTFLTDHTSEFKQRWGGWYVTGTHGAMRHMGNEVCEGTDRDPQLDREAGANVTSLEGRIQTEKYLSPHSDIVALMVMEHQTQVHNAITAANFEARRAIFQSKQMNKLLERPIDHLSESAVRRIDRAAENVVKHLLLCGEFPLRGEVSGTSGFAAQFQNRGPRDSSGRSLREFDLQTRLFRYPCSYLIYSPAFDALPDEVRTRVTQRLKMVLQGEDDADEYDHLSVETRRQILAILQDTKPALFRKPASKS